MSDTQLPSLHEALADASGARRLLLGNGFSIAWNSDIFSYGSLYDRADFSQVSPSAAQAFEALGTRDFETVMRRLNEAALLLEIYSPNETGLIQTLRADADGLRDLLVQTIADNHPARPNEVSAEQYAACRAFLAPFETVYTLNYDLLLYWTIMQDAEGLPDAPKNDGFDYDPDEPDAPWVTWDSQASSQRQKLFYVHGALHVYDAGASVQKYTWSRSGDALIDQIRSALEDRKFPLFVAEDSAANKMNKIIHHGYLHKAIRSLESQNGSLVTFGFGFGDNDGHVLRAIAKSTIRKILVGLYGDPTSKENLAIQASAKALQADRPNWRSRSDLEVTFFDAASARVWG
ncbi:MAG: DUF4917 family protein [Phycisphaerales bacterium JB052]